MIFNPRKQVLAADAFAHQSVSILRDRERKLVNFERVKLLVDENLSPRLVTALADVYPGSAHVHKCGLDSASTCKRGYSQ